MRNEHFELHKALKERIKGKIFIGVKEDETLIEIVGFKSIVWKFGVKDISNIEEVVNLVERKYHNFILNKFFNRREK